MTGDDDAFTRYVFDDVQPEHTQPPLTLDEINALLVERYAESRKRLVVPPARFDEIREQAQRAGLWVEVVASPLLNDDQAVLIPSEAEMRENMERLFRDEMAADFRRETAALVAEIREEIEKKAAAERIYSQFHPRPGSPLIRPGGL
jgi:hypothetical protein